MIRKVTSWWPFFIRGHRVNWRMINYDGRIFVSVTNSGNGDVGAETRFQYRQSANVVTAIYSGGSVLIGHLLASCDVNGVLDARYHHINIQGALMTGECRSAPELLPDGRIRLHESWQWTCGDRSEGSSIIEELRP